MKAKYIALSIGIALSLWITRQDKPIATTEPVRVAARDVETLVYGADPETDFTPGVKPGGLIKVTELNPMDIRPEDMYYQTMDMLARCVEAEAGNQGLEGKRLVVDVILNRTKDPDFPDTIQEVITQPYHFSVYWNGAMDRAEVSEETWQAIRMELNEISYPGVLYFTNEDYLEYGTPWKQVGDHYFNTK
ncbi:MAG: cell wall hydrolase [Lachnospiraceae bacterium]|nr:cell wall hydrolase [Lachnospiraceae bacterium]